MMPRAERAVTVNADDAGSSAVGAVPADVQRAALSLALVADAADRASINSRMLDVVIRFARDMGISCTMI